MNTQFRPGLSPTQNAFHDLLRWLDDGVDSRGEKYLEMHRRLVSYFVRKKCLSPADLADETLARVVRRLEEIGVIADMPAARYCYITARFIFLEYLRRIEHRQISLDELTRAGHSPSCLTAPSQSPGALEVPATLACLNRCLLKLSAGQRDLIREYYRGETQTKIARRRDLAARLGLTMNALSIRACRIREKLEACVKTALGSGQ